MTHLSPASVPVTVQQKMVVWGFDRGAWATFHHDGFQPMVLWALSGRLWDMETRQGSGGGCFFLASQRLSHIMGFSFPGKVNVKTFKSNEYLCKALF